MVFWWVFFFSWFSTFEDRDEVRDLSLMHAISQDWDFKLHNEGVCVFNRAQYSNSDQILLDENDWKSFFSKAKLFFYFESIHCGSCVENEIRLLNSLFKKDDVVLLTKKKNSREWEVFKKLNNIDFEVIFWDTHTDPYEEDNLFKEAYRPFYFLMNDEGQLMYIHTAKFSYLELSENYLRKIKKEFF